MKGLFFYRNPGEEKVYGYECNIELLKAIHEFDEGFLVTTFNKDIIYSFVPVRSMSITELDKLVRKKAFLSADSFDSYSHTIKNAVAYCRENDGKVVVSRIVLNELPKEFSLSEFFLSLCSKYDHAFNYCFSIEDGDIWIGATPEVLTRSSNEGCITYSLAGSRNVNNRFDWTAKEYAEQRFVTDSIREVLDNMELNYQISETKTVNAGNVEHLLSEFQIQTTGIMELADKLHPTPAVCGMPKRKALDFIRKNEKHDRSFYAGIIGWKKGEEVSLYVNLRCAQIFEDKMACYVGGGITKDSEVEREWEETNFKSQTLLSVLKKN